MMSLEERNLILKVQKVLLNCHIISTPIHDIENGVVNHKRRRFVYFVHGLFWLHFVLTIIRVFASKDSLLYLYSIDSMSAFGYLGRLLNATHLVGYPMCYFHSLTVLMNEKKRTLAPVTNLNEMFDNLPNRSRTETKYFTFNLTLLSYLPFLHLTGTIPIMILKGFGAIMSFD